MMVNSALEHVICGMRLQPIYSLANNNIQAWEVLSALSAGMDNELFFSSLSEYDNFKVLCWQLDAIKGKGGSKKYFINAPAKVLSQSGMVEKIIPGLHPGVVIEIQDPYGFISLNYEEQHNFKSLQKQIKSTGAEIWLDDVKKEHLLMLGESICLFDGVKIDKTVIWDNLLTPQLFKSMISYCLLMVKEVLVEGIENQKQFDFVQMTGCSLLQGFMWPEERLDIRYAEV